jgi:hypothetical protein
MPCGLIAPWGKKDLGIGQGNCKLLNANCKFAIPDLQFAIPPLAEGDACRLPAAAIWLRQKERWA